MASALGVAVVACLALELWARMELPQVREQAIAYGTPLAEEARARDLQRVSGIPDPSAAPEPDKDAAAWEAVLNSGDDAACAALAGRTGYWLVRVDAAGVIHASFPPDRHSDEKLATTAERVRPDESVLSLLNPAEAADFHSALESARQGNAAPARFYNLSLPDGSSCLSEWHIGTVDHASGTLPLRVGLSLWEQFGLRYRANIDVTNPLEQWGAPTRLRTNAQGWRDDPMEVPKPDGVRRIVCIGGSTTAGGPRGDLTYPNLTEQRLRTALGDDRIEVVNCGVYAAGSDTVRKLLPDILALQPDIVVQYNFINDFLPSHRGWYGASITDLIKAFLARSTFVRLHFNAWLLPGKEAIRRGYRDATLDNFKATLEACRSAGARVAFASFAYPTLDTSEPDYILYTRFDPRCTDLDSLSYGKVVDLCNDELKRFCEAEGAIYIPVAENVRGGIPYFMDMCHMRLPALESMADTVAESLEQVLVSVQ
ncbi:MAG: hypothetical protein GC168_07580 [Candidatus Hydrogenedens sp.]|nr:hypothetical protein [Candidatus Hydrogenedens sp.]